MMAFDHQGQGILSLVDSAAVQHVRPVELRGAAWGGEFRRRQQLADNFLTAGRRKLWLKLSGPHIDAVVLPVTFRVSNVRYPILSWRRLRRSGGTYECRKNQG